MSAELSPSGNFGDSGDESGVEFSGELHSSDFDITEFDVVLGAVRSSFLLAVRRQAEIKGFKMFTVDYDSPETGGNLGHFTVADPRKLLYDAERIRLAVPIEEIDVDQPELLRDPGNNFFIVYKKIEEVTDYRLVDALNAPEELFGDRPFIDNFAQKALTYEPVPVRSTTA